MDFVQFDTVGGRLSVLRHGSLANEHGDGTPSRKPWSTTTWTKLTCQPERDVCRAISANEHKTMGR